MIIYSCKNIFTAKEGVDTAIDGYFAVEDGIITAVGENPIPADLKEKAEKVEHFEGTICPGFIDAHTHLVHGGARENELQMKLAGKSYIEIHNAGGGINSTVRSTRETSHADLKKKALKHLDTMLIHGTTTVESKSGYGLDMDTEIKCLEVNKEINEEHPVDIVPTYMGAHATPPEFKGNKDGYIKYMIEEVMPEVKKRGLADFVDSFCEDEIFSVEETERVMQGAKDLGFNLKVHADEIVPFNGAELAAKMGAVSAEHLMAVSDQGIKDMAKAGVTAVLLPSTSFFLMSPIYAPAKKMIEEGVRVAIATDFNPGSSPTENLQMSMWVACFKMKLTPAQILRGVTLNAAHAVKREKTVGSIEVGKQADFVVFDAKNIDFIVYHLGVNSVSKVFKNGELVVDERRVVYKK